MICSADDLAVRRDFPRGLRVLLLDLDGPSAAETKSKLEAVDYIVSSYYNEKDALEAISARVDSFHVAIVEVTADNSYGIFKFLELAKDLPTIVISNVRCLNTMMKCIALGAAEFLQKPLSEDKLRNIWQHVVHKAFNAGGNALSKSLKPIKEKVASMLQLQSDTVELKIEIPSEAENIEKDHETEHENKEENCRLPAHSTPWLAKGTCQDQPNCSTETESRDNANDLIEVRKNSLSASKSVDNTCNIFCSAVNSKEVLLSRLKHAAEEEVNSADGSKTNKDCSDVKEGTQPSSHMHSGENIESSADNPKKKKSFLHCTSCSNNNRGNGKRMKVDWTPELHRRFVQAVELLGIDQAIPSKILEMMKVEGLTRHNIASHLQKFRLHRRHILPKDDDKRWKPHRDAVPKVYMQKPLVAFPPFHSNCVPPVWGHPRYHPPGVQMWGHTGFPTWHPPQESWHWKTYPGIHADAWGCPIATPYNQCSIPPQINNLSKGLDAAGGGTWVSKDSYDLAQAEEVIDEVVKEAMSKTWLPLPLGLKPPSTDVVLAELHRQGIRTIPPTNRRSSIAPPPPSRR